MKPYCIHYDNKQKARALLPADSKILHDQFHWMIVRIPGMNWEAVQALFKNEALVGICEQKEYLTNEEKKHQVEEWQINATLPIGGSGCNKHSWSV